MTASTGDRTAATTTEAPAGGRSPQPERTTDRITVALIPRAADDLQRLHARTGLSKTDIANRAITLYEFIDAAISAGGELLIKDKDNEVKSVLII